MSGATITALVVALMFGAMLGSMYQAWTGHYRHMAALTARYEAERNYLDSKTAVMIAELKQYSGSVQQDLKTKQKETKRYGKKKN